MTSQFPTGNYPPYGYNDNNFNRQHFPSNIFPPQGGRSGAYFNRFDPLTTNLIDQMNQLPNMSKITESFEPNHPMIEPIDYRNKNHLIHNNVSTNVLDEHVVEYRMNIDSLDRDINYYLDPFYFTVKFNPPGGSSVKEEMYRNPKCKEKGTIIKETHFNPSPEPHINKEFRNVKYIKLENIVLPLYSETIEEDDVIIFDPTSRLIDDRFTSLVIKELEWERTVATYDNVTRYDPNTGKLYTPPRQFSVLLPDKVGKYYFTGLPFYGSRVYNNSLLGNINQMTFDFRDSCGAPIRYNDLYTAEELCEAQNNGNPIPITNLRHPLNKKINLHMSFIVGVVEGQINTNTQLEI